MFLFRSVRQQFFSITPSPQQRAAMADAGTKVKQLIDKHSVMLFSKSYCPYCKATKEVLNSLHADYTAIELDHESDGSALQDALEQLTGQRTVPNLLIKRKHIGGNSDVQSLVKDGKLADLLQEADALKA